MYWKLPLISMGLLTASVGVGYLIWQGWAAVEQPATLQQQIESDLQLRAELMRAGPLQAGIDPWVSVTLVNRSRTVTHRVIRPGPGSESGYLREPHVYWTASIDRGDGNRVPVTDTRPYVHECGNVLFFASGWPNATIPFKPGDKLELDPPLQFEFQQEGRVRLQAHYEYRAGEGRGGQPPSPEDLARVAGLPHFKLSSNPDEFEVVRPLDVRIRVKGPLKVEHKTRLSDLLDISLVNCSQKDILCSSPTRGEGAHLGLRVEGQFGGWSPTMNEHPTTPGVTIAVKPGEEMPLLGMGQFANGTDGTWEHPKKGRVKVRAVYVPAGWGNGPGIMSEWAEVQVE